MAREAHSVTGDKSLSVAPSPLNEVKLDLGVILVVGLLLLLVQGKVVASLTLQLLLLVSYGLLGLIWIVVRTRRIVARLAQVRDQDRHGA